MLHIILSLLKIIGFFILILLGILLFLIIAVFAAPVTYDFSGEWDGKPCLRGRIHWLYHIVGVSVVMKDMRPEIQLSIFGRIPGSGKKKKKKRASAGKEMKSQDESPAIEDQPVRGDQTDLMSYEKSVDTDISSNDWEEDTEEKKVESSDDAAEISDAPAIGDEAEINDETEIIDEAEINDETEIEKALEEDMEKEPLEKSDRDIFAMIHRGMDFFNQPSVRKLISRLWGSIRRIIRHLRPSGLRIQARIGTGDPGLTGKIMEFAAILYAFYYENIEIVSEFDEKVLEGRFSVRGWLVPGYLIIKILGMALRILLNRECRAFYREIKESLT